MKIKFTPLLWTKILGFAIIDPDGWDRTGDFNTDWNEPLSLDEFLDKADNSTCGPRPNDRRTYFEIASNRIVPNFPNSKVEVQKML